MGIEPDAPREGEGGASWAQVSEPVRKCPPAGSETCRRRPDPRVALRAPDALQPADRGWPGHLQAILSAHRNRPSIQLFR